MNNEKKLLIPVLDIYLQNVQLSLQPSSAEYVFPVQMNFHDNNY